MALASGGSRVPSCDFYGENWRYGLYWLCLAMTFLKVLFWELRLSLGWKLQIFDQAMTTFVHLFLLKRCCLWRTSFVVWMLSLVGGLVCCYCKCLVTMVGSFFFFVFIWFSGCVHPDVFGHLVGQKLGVIGLSMILIYSSYKKIKNWPSCSSRSWV
jgi:hypothetical protein